MIEKDKLKELIKSYLPHAADKTIESIAKNVSQDAVAVIHSMVRQAVNQEKEHLYRKNSRN